MMAHIAATAMRSIVDFVHPVQPDAETHLRAGSRGGGRRSEVP
jgi:hypothetical protein